MMSEHDILAVNVLPAFEASLEHGLTESELEQIGWTAAFLRSADASVSGSQTYQHMEIMVQKASYPAFFRDAVLRYTLGSLGPVGLACKTAEHVGEALALHGRYQALTNRTATFETTIELPEVRFTERRTDERLGSKLMSEYSLSVFANIVRTHLAIPFKPTCWVRRELDAEDLEMLNPFLGDVSGGATRAQIAFNAELLTQPVQSSDKELFNYFQTVLESLSPNEPEVVTEIRTRLQKSFITGGTTADDIARQLGMSRRTMQRRLSEHGLTFTEVVDETRKALAREHLGRGLSVTEVAYLLGFSEYSSFYRAYKRWFGTSPTASK